MIQRQGFKKSKSGIRIGNDVWIGSLTSVLDGSTLGNGCVVGASSLVRGNLDEFGVYVGNPLRKITSRTARLQINCTTHLSAQKNWLGYCRKGSKV